MSAKRAMADAMYADKAPALPQKAVITAIELGLLGLSAWILFGPGTAIAADLFGFTAPASPPARRWLVFAFSTGVLIRMAVMMFRFMRRNIPWRETGSVPMAFALYYIGFALLVLPSDATLDLVDAAAIAIYALGSWLNTAGELGRDRFKRRAENKGKLYTEGPFAYSMHINFFGDILWVAAYAMVTRNPWAATIPVALTLFFALYNVPALDRYLAGRYGADFQAYRARTKRLIPFVW